MRDDTVAWVITHFLPFEAELRNVLRRVCGRPEEVDDVIQDVYSRVLDCRTLAHVREPKAFLVQTAKNLLTDKLRREAVVRIDAVANLEDLDVPGDSPDPERIAMARAELKWVIGLIANLPARCKAVFRARRIYGMSQKETAETVGISEELVEYETRRGLDLISKMIERVGMESAQGNAALHKTPFVKKKNVHDL
jgi:RNA polymerase sigma-70 factor (ECF subfamily)